MLWPFFEKRPGGSVDERRYVVQYYIHIYRENTHDKIYHIVRCIKLIRYFCCIVVIYPLLFQIPNASYKSRQWESWSRKCIQSRRLTKTVQCHPHPCTTKKVCFYQNSFIIRTFRTLKYLTTMMGSTMNDWHYWRSWPLISRTWHLIHLKFCVVRRSGSILRSHRTLDNASSVAKPMPKANGRDLGTVTELCLWFECLVFKKR